MRGPIHAMLRCPLGFHSDVPVKNQIRPSRSTFMKERREAFNQSYGIIDARPVSIRGSSSAITVKPARVQATERGRSATAVPSRMRRTIGSGERTSIQGIHPRGRGGIIADCGRPCRGENRRIHWQILAAAKRHCSLRTARAPEPGQLNIRRGLSSIGQP